MKKGLIFATTLAMALGVGVAVSAHRNEAKAAKAVDAVVYLLPSSNWAEANARFEVWNWSNDQDGEWLDMTEVATDPGTYKTTLVSGKNNLIFVRKGPSQTHHTWDQIWTQSANLTYDSTKTRYEVSGWDSGEWKAYSEPAAASVYKYALNGVVAAEPMTKGSGTEYSTPSLTFAKGDVVSFLKDDASYAVTPKEDGQLTKVYSVETGLKFAEAYTGALYLETNGALLWAGQFTPGYYLAGVGGEWNAKLGLAAADNLGSKLVENVSLAANAEIKFVEFPSEGKQLSWKNAEADKVDTSTEVEYEVITEGDGTGNLKVVNAGTYDVSYNPNNGHYTIEDVNYVPDVPASDGYYLVGTQTSWKYATAPKMSADPVGENNAIYSDYVSSADEKLKVRMYQADRQEGADVYGRFVENEASAGIATVDVQGNMVFAAADLHVDIFAKWVKTSEDPDVWELLFYVAAHAERHTISVYDVLFEGKRLASTAEVPHLKRATEGVNFEYDQVAMNGYVSRGIYTDAACTVEYTPAKYTADGTLYAKYTKLGYYITGDATYSGSEALAWEVDGASMLSSAVNDPQNLFEGSVVIPEGASAQSPVKVKALQFTGYDKEAEGKHTTWANISYTLGEEYSFISLDGDSNFCFSKSGVFSVYVKEPAQGSDKFIVYLSQGAQAFYTMFLDDTGAVCKTDNTTDKVRLGELWAEFEAAYNSLTADEKEAIVAVGSSYVWDEKDNDDLHKMVGRYNYIIHKYGTGAGGFKDFIFSQNLSPNPAHGGLINDVVANNPTLIIVLSISMISALAFGALIVIKKRKHQ